MAGRGREWDFFISYTQADRTWAEWIAWLLEEDHHRVLIQAWDFVWGGSNWVQRMRDGVLGAGRTVAVLSPDYLQSEFGTAEWTAAWSTDPLAAERAGALHPRGHLPRRDGAGPRPQVHGDPAAPAASVPAS
jgi:TIR domain-containing protein